MQKEYYQVLSWGNLQLTKRLTRSALSCTAWTTHRSLCSGGLPVSSALCIKMKKASYLIINVSAVIVFLIFAYLANNEFTLVVLGFGAWALSPYLYLLILVKLSTNKNIKYILVSVLVTCILGVTLQINTTLIGVNAQGGLALLFIPVYQWVVLILTTIVLVVFKVVKNA